MATLRAVLLFSNLMAMAFFTALSPPGALSGGLAELAAELFVEQVQESLLAFGQVALFGGYNLFEVLRVVGYHGTLHVVVYYPRADVRRSRYVAGVSQPLGDRVDGFQHVLARAFRLCSGTKLGEFDGGDQGSRPRPEVLGCELLSHDPLDVGVEIPGLHVAHAAVFVDVLEDLVARQRGALLDHLAQPAVRDDLPVGLAPLAAILEGHGVALDAKVLAPEGCYAVGPVLLGVALVAHPEVCCVHQPGH